MGYTASKLISIAAGEIGYIEKETNSHLDDKKANAGDNNWTKYARDLRAKGYYNGNKNGYAWCDVFVDWCFLQLCEGDADAAQAMTCQTGPYGAGCKHSANYYRNQGRFFVNDPKVGDQIFFRNYSHTGIVEKIDGNIVYTIEGNTSDKVARRTYSITSKNIDGYGRPKFDTESEESNEENDDMIDATQPDTVIEFMVGDIVMFNGNKHYGSTNASAGYSVKASKVKITSVCKTGRHQYHCRSVNESGKYIAGVYGWVDATDLSSIEDSKPSQPDTPVAQYSIKKGDVVSIAKNATYYSGKDIPDWVVDKDWIVSETPTGDRVVINKSVDGRHAINSPIHAKFLTVVNTEESWVPEVGDIVNFTGNKHYVNANANSGSACKGGKAKITNIYQLGKSKHPYHLVRVAGKGATVYGWVDEGTFTKA